MSSIFVMKNITIKGLNKYKVMPQTVKVSFWFVVCSVIQKGISMFTLPLFTRILSTEQFGQLSIYQSWSSIICIFTTLNLQYGSFNTALIKFENDSDSYISSVQSIGTILTFLILGIYSINPVLWSRILGIPTNLIAVLVFEILGMFSLALWSAKQRFCFKYKTLVSITLLMSISSPILAYIFITITDEKGIARILAFACINISIGFFIYIYNLIKGKVIIHGKYWRFALGFNVPLIPYYISQIIFNNSDRIMIGKMVGMDKAGIYSVAYSISLVFIFVLEAINSSFSPWMFKKIRDKEYYEISDISNRILLFWILLLCMLMLFAPDIILLMAGEKYYEAKWVVPPVVASMCLLYLARLTSTFQFYYEKNWYLVLGAIGSAIINIILNYYFINIFGYCAAGYTTLISYIFLWLISYFFMLKICKEHIINVKEIISFRIHLITVSTFLLFMFFVIFLYLNNYIRWGVALIILLIIINKHKSVLINIKEVLNLNNNRKY